MECNKILFDPSCRDCGWKGAIRVPPPPVPAAGDPNALVVVCADEPNIPPEGAGVEAPKAEVGAVAPNPPVVLPKAPPEGAGALPNKPPVAGAGALPNKPGDGAPKAVVCVEVAPKVLVGADPKPVFGDDAPKPVDAGVPM